MRWSRDGFQAWPWLRSGWSHQRGWTELCLCDWTGFVCLRNFQSWSPLVLIFFFYQTPTEFFSLCIPYPYILPTASPQWTRLYLAIVCRSYITIPLLFMNKFIFFWQLWACHGFFFWLTVSYSVFFLFSLFCQQDWCGLPRINQWSKKRFCFLLLTFLKLTWLLNQPENWKG